MVLVFGIVGAIAYTGEPTVAQITPDATLGAESSVITPNDNVRGFPADLIEGGATRGVNLFHSFSEFNIDDQQRVYFANHEGIENILTRVTGDTLSGSTQRPLVEAQGWVINERGEVVLTEQVPTVSPHESGFQVLKCNAPAAKNPPRS
ncbi:MAG: filamentous hemagglutinin N-terminal domain-containing protein [Symplocastrum torsivum CPER-KK1]|uniref:Filamentous hemagglutinin N-terminal domain-containing protein n=1 Tax=Symplocastrum torsivum CPER-KK1 TaxID=450513 RepID=A0A951U7V7_9CYAN|nr:filamentous hemagglutinin N-terminal domain-containing protein [Symplocastrum torsivum CPER-KK1]